MRNLRRSLALSANKMIQGCKVGPPANAMHKRLYSACVILLVMHSLRFRSHRNDHTTHTAKADKSLQASLRPFLARYSNGTSSGGLFRISLSLSSREWSRP